jgi:hypothetical protein
MIELMLAFIVLKFLSRRKQIWFHASGHQNKDYPDTNKIVETKHSEATIHGSKH